MFVSSFWLRSRVQKIICELRELGDYPTIHPLREMQRRALDDTVAFLAEQMPRAVGYYTPRELLDYALSAVELPGAYLEFGVFKGASIRHIARRVSGPVHGFDSFEGLQEDWAGHRLARGAFNLSGKPPRVPANVELHAGWFEKTLPEWRQANPGSAAFIHIDCDLYSSARTVFTELASLVRPGTVILFDEFFNYPGWRDHEFKAFGEAVSESRWSFDYLGYARTQVAVRITAIG